MRRVIHFGTGNTVFALAITSQLLTGRLLTTQTGAFSLTGMKALERLSPTSDDSPLVAQGVC